MNANHLYQYKNKFIGFIDILGFKSLVEKSENNSDINLDRIIKILEILKNQKDQDFIKSYGPEICPQSKYIDKDLDFKVIQISDCVIVSSEVSSAGIINLIKFCWKIVLYLLEEGILCRGYITQGNIYHENDQVIGSGYQKAFKNESRVSFLQKYSEDTGTPFVEIDQVVCNYVQNECDSCVKTMFDRFVKTSNSVSGIFPFQLLSHSFIINKDFNADKEKRNNDVIRKKLNMYIEKILMYADVNDEKAMKKINHYIDAIKIQIELCSKTDEMIDKLSLPIGMILE